MRATNFLRTPIRADHQARMRNLLVTEQLLTGDPSGGSFLQALRITFETSETEVQIAALWEGRMRFIPDTTAGYPLSPEEVTEDNFSAWPLEGDLVLHTEDFSLHQPFATHIKLIAFPPSLVRYSKIRLTSDFLFSTLRQVLLPLRMREEDKAITLNDADPFWHQKLIIAFLQGHVSVNCFLDQDDPSKDFTTKPMPSVALTPVGQSSLTITASSRCSEVYAATWFRHQPQYDNIPGVPLLSPSMAPTGRPTMSQGPNATVLIDTNARFQTTGVKKGFFVSNVTDGGLGVVESVNSETQLTHTPLEKGQNNDWKVTDIYQLYDLHDQFYNPSHPGHSVIPLAAIFATANEETFEGQHRGSALWEAIRAFSAAGARYRRIDIVRPPRPGSPVSSQPQRPFPQYQINWQKIGDPSISSLRLPLSGHVYIPLREGQYKFWAIPRGQRPQEFHDGDQLKLSVKRDDRKYIDLPGGSVVVDILSGDTSKTIFAHLFEYDSSFAWHAFASLNREQVVEPLRSEYARRWNVRADDEEKKINYFYLWPQVQNKSPRMETYKYLYGHIVGAAGRHGIAPEFLQAVLIGEGIYVNYIRDEANGPYRDDQVFDTYYVGLDKVGGLREKDPTAGYYSEWISQSYTDGDHFGHTVTSFEVVQNKELDPDKNPGLVGICPPGGCHYTRAEITGYEAVVEWTVTELHFGLDWMVRKIREEGLEPISTEDERRFIAYVFFNTYFPATRGTILREFRDSDKTIRKWKGEYPGNKNARFNSLLRLAIAQFLEELGIYR